MDSAFDIARRVRAGESSPMAAAEEAFAAIDARDDDIHAFLHVTKSEAQQLAEKLAEKVERGEDPGLLAGVPVAIKDLMCTKGIPTTCGSRILEGWIPPYNATVVERLCNAGAIMVGKTNTDEFGMGSSTENSGYGPTKNPHDLTKVPGGSSGGSTAAVAANMASLALGTDTGGSIRQPSHLCGVVGLRPTYGRVSRYGVVPYASSLDQVGPIAANVRDLALMTQVISGHDPMDSTSLDEPVPNYVEVLDRGVANMRVGVIKELLAGGLSKDVETKVRTAAEALANMGARVEEVSVPAVTLGLSAYYIIAPAEASSNLARFDGVRYGIREERPELDDMYAATRAKGFGAEVKRRIMLGTYVLSAGYYDAFYAKAQKVRTLIMRDFAKAYDNFDVLLGPVAPTTAFGIGEFVDDPLAMYMQDICTIPTNLAGHPAMSVPFGKGDDNMPVGVQLLGPALSEPTLMQAAAAIERAAQSVGGEK